MSQKLPALNEAQSFAARSKRPTQKQSARRTTPARKFAPADHLRRNARRSAPRADAVGSSDGVSRPALRVERHNGSIEISRRPNLQHRPTRTSTRKYFVDPRRRHFLAQRFSALL